MNEHGSPETLASGTRPTAEIVRQLMARERDGLFSDVIIARTAVMLGDLARQLLGAAARAETEGVVEAQGYEVFVSHHERALAAVLENNSGLLAHCHALAVESVLADELHARAAIDPALSPLLKSLLASQDDELSSAAMHVLAAQARFLHNARRMELPLRELPAELFHEALSGLSALAELDLELAELTKRTLIAGYSEAGRRISHLSRLTLILSERDKPVRSLSEAGLALFVSSFAHASGEDRDQTVLAFGESAPARLAKLLTAAEWPAAEASEALSILHPHGDLPLSQADSLDA